LVFVFFFPPSPSFVERKGKETKGKEGRRTKERHGRGKEEETKRTGSGHEEEEGARDRKP